MTWFSLFLIGGTKMLMVNKQIAKALLIVLALIPFVSGCATSKKVQAVQIGDNNLTKQELVAELAKLDNAQKEIESKKGVTGTNVASALFWWPGLAYTYYDASEANRLIEQRRAHLTSLYNQKVAQEGGSRSRS
jgi:hypothetical protein